MILPKTADDKTIIDNISEIKDLYKKHGIKALHENWLKENYGQDAYEVYVAKKGTTLRDVAQKLGVWDELIQFRKQQRNQVNWTNAKMQEVGQILIEEHGCIPATGWLGSNGYSGLIWAIQKTGGMDVYRNRFVASSISRLVSRGGIRHDSFAEVAAANFLWSRGINVSKGRKYPDLYAKMSGRAHGWYDLEFTGMTDLYDGHTILIEIWGDSSTGGPGGGNAAKVQTYLDTKCKKLECNRNNPYFLSFNYKDCYNESRLQHIFQPYIGSLPVIRYKSEIDKHIPSNLLNMGDEVIGRCKWICSQIAGGILPPHAWFDRIRTYKDRKVYDWEPVS